MTVPSEADFYHDVVDLDTGKPTRYARKRSVWRGVRALAATYLSLIIAAEAYKEWEAWWTKR